MATISENLQIIKNSTDAIKQAIIDKGGTIEGDISTWADAISGLSGGGSNEEEIIFRGTLTTNMTKIIKNSTDAIKQAIIDKGGTIEGDITTWANAISGLSGGGSNEEEIIFRGTLTTNMTKIIIRGTLDSKPQHNDALYFCALGFNMGGIVSKSQSITMTNVIDITLDMGEPIVDAKNTNFIIIESNYNGRCPIWKVNFIENTSQG